jgi:hypothetical protein
MGLFAQSGRRHGDIPELQHLVRRAVIFLADGLHSAESDLLDRVMPVAAG